jgi:hypothetical protein
LLPEADPKSNKSLRFFAEDSADDEAGEEDYDKLWEAVASAVVLKFLELTENM